MTLARNDGLVRLFFDLENDASHGYASESVWAEKVGRDRYRLRNTPFYAYGISAEDVVFAERDTRGLRYKGVSLHGGHSTYRIIRSAAYDEESFRRCWMPIQELGCSYEEGPNLLAVDVPPKADAHKVYELLERGESAGCWHFEEGHCGHPIGKPGSG